MYDIFNIEWYLPTCLVSTNIVWYLPTLFGIYLHCLVSTYIVWYLPTLYGIYQHCMVSLTLFGIYLHCLVSNLHCMVSTYTVWYVSSYLHCMVSTYIALIFYCFFVYFYAICGTFKKSLIRTTWLQGLSLCNCFAGVVKCVEVQQNFVA